MSDHAHWLTPAALRVHVLLWNIRGVCSLANPLKKISLRSSRGDSASLVNETQSKSWGFALAEEKEFFAKVCKFLPIANSLLLEKLDNLDQEVAMLETPTPRELELLALIEAGLSNQQLADRLSLSVPTVKWHLYNLYNKLGVSSRAAALAKGRVLNLVGK
jgi:LuxR family maltose regulon positive regulatory protein